MKDLELLGLHPDGNQLILNDEEGTRYALAITQELRDTLRPERPNLEAVPQSPKKTVPPRKIQSLIRAGSTANEIADKFELPLAKVQRYATPILAERRHIANQAQSCQIGGESDSPRLGELVVDRLAARGVAAASLRWDAVRGGKGPWEIILTFTQDARDLTARWHMEPGSSTVSALDQEATWLTEAPQPASKVSSFEEFFPVTSPETTTPQKPDTGTEALLEALAAARGKRDISPDLQLPEETELEEISDFEGEPGDTQANTPAEIVSLSGKRQGSPTAEENPAVSASAQSQSDFSPVEDEQLREKSTIPQAEPAAQLPQEKRPLDQVWDSSEPTFVGNLSEAEALNLDLTRRAPASSARNEAGEPSRPAPPPPALTPDRKLSSCREWKTLKKTIKPSWLPGKKPQKPKVNIDVPTVNLSPAGTILSLVLSRGKYSNTSY